MGLAQLGLDVGRLLLVETRTDKDALWAHRGDAAVRGAAGHGGRRDGRQPRPHHQPPAEPRRRRACHAARPPAHRRIAAGTSAAATRWRIAAAPAARDRFGAFAAPALARGAGALPQRPSRTSGLSSGIMSRIVSVWLRAWPIARLLQRQASAAPAEHPT